MSFLGALPWDRAPCLFQTSELPDIFIVHVVPGAVCLLVLFGFFGTKCMVLEITCVMLRGSQCKNVCMFPPCLHQRSLPFRVQGRRTVQRLAEGRLAGWWHCRGQCRMLGPFILRGSLLQLLGALPRCRHHPAPAGGAPSQTP